LKSQGKIFILEIYREEIKNSEIRERIRGVFDYVTESIMEGVAPKFEGIIDTRSNEESLEFDFGVFRMKINQEKIRRVDIDMIG
jgi:hypothetical protein